MGLQSCSYNIFNILLHEKAEPSTVFTLHNSTCFSLSKFGTFIHGSMNQVVNSHLLEKTQHKIKRQAGDVTQNLNI